MTPWAAKWADCWEDPHWRSTLVPTTDSGNPAARAALRPMFRPCSPVCMTQPMITSSTSAGSILLVEDGQLYVAASDPDVDEAVANLRIPVGTGLAGRAVADSRTVYSPDLDNDDRVDPVVRNTGSNKEIKSFLVVPLVCLGESIGAIEVDSASPEAFDDVDRTVLEGLATQMAGAIESARRYEEMLEL